MGFRIFSKDWFRDNPFKVLLLVLIVVVASVVAAHAYLSLLLPERVQTGPRVSITSPPLEFSVELDKAEYQYEENISVTFCLKNISNQTIRVIYPAMSPMHPPYEILITEANGANTPNSANLLSYLFHFGFAITDSNGTEVFELRGFVPTIYYIDYEPGGYVKQTFIHYYFMDGSPYPEDTYQIRGILYRVNISFPELITLETPSITFAIK